MASLANLLDVYDLEPGDRVFVDTASNVAATHWRSVIEPRRISELADPLKEYAAGITREGRADATPLPTIT